MSDIVVILVAVIVYLEAIKVEGGFPVCRSLLCSINVEGLGECSVLRACAWEEDSAGAEALRQCGCPVPHCDVNLEYELEMRKGMIDVLGKCCVHLKSLYVSNVMRFH